MHNHNQDQAFMQRIAAIDGPLMHSVIITFHDTTSEPAIQSVISKLRSLERLEGVVHFTIQESLDQRKGQIWIEVAEFESGPTFLRWRDHPSHIACTDELKHIADWHTADYAKAED